MLAALSARSHLEQMGPHQVTGNAAMDLQRDAEGENRSSLASINVKPDDKSRSNTSHEGAAVAPSDKAEFSDDKKTHSDSSTGVEMDEIRKMMEDIGPDRFALFVYLGLMGIAILSIVGFFLLSWSWIVAIANVFIAFVIVSPVNIPNQQKNNEK